MNKIAVTPEANAKAGELSAVIHLGPQSAEALGLPVGHPIDLGVLAYWHRNPLKRALYHARKHFDPRLRGEVELAQRHAAYAASQLNQNDNQGG